MNTSRAFQPCAIWTLLGLLTGAGVGAVAAAETPLDPVVAEVIEMLQAGVGEELIVQWFESTDRRPADIGSQGMIALTEAGASERLISALLQRVGNRDGGMSAEESLPALATGVGETDASHSVSKVSPAAPVGQVEVIARLGARRVWTEEDEPDREREERWDVFLYLDGELLAWTRPALQGEPVEVRRVVAAGRRELRVVLQRYEEQRTGWLYESLSVPTLFAFEAPSGEPVEIEVEMKPTWGLWRQRSDGGPLSYRIRQGDRILAEHDGTGGDPNRWNPVCEDVEANFPDADTVPGRFRNPMSRCVRWAELWSGPGRSTSRAEILVRLKEHGFQPPVR